MQPSITVGDTLDFTTALSAYPASAGWVMKFRLIPRGAGSPISITCSASGANHRAQVDATATAGWTAGAYGWASWVEQGAIVNTVDSGTVQLTPNLRVAPAGTETRTLAAIALAAAEAALAAWTPTTKRYVINGREMEFKATAEIVDTIAYWRTQVQAETRAADRAAGRPDRRKTYVRLSR